MPFEVDLNEVEGMVISNFCGELLFVATEDGSRAEKVGEF
jgi:hypothetical protein